jgi:hypothetical protein
MPSRRRSELRRCGDDLILVDVHASLIVDVLPRAIVEYTIK